MGKKGSVLMISLWILAILVVFALGLGHRASINLRLARYQRDRLKALYLANVGINRAIAEIINDSTQNYDSLKDNWTDNKKVFEKIVLKEESAEENPAEFATVSYKVKDQTTGEEGIIYGVIDEERKVNINSLNKYLLQQLFILRGYETDAEGLADVIIKWINSEKEEGKEIFKNKSFKTLEELLLILEYYYQEEKKEEKYREKAQEIYNRIKDLITAYGDGKININTAHDEDVLKALAITVAKLNEKNEAFAQSLIPQIIAFVSENPFKDQETLNSTEIGKEQEEKDIFNLMKEYLMIKSNYFKIESVGNVGQITKKIAAIYDRGTKKIVYWHEN